MCINFNEIEANIENTPGIYEIYTNQGIALKVGIGINIRKRLLIHRASRQGGLQLIPGGNFLNPNDVISKSSILAKHLYFDETITEDYDLQTQIGRRNFLIENCYIKFEATQTKELARELEIAREQIGLFRYQGAVIIR